MKMVNYVCRTCLYVCNNEFSFKRLEKVKQVLELFVPEIRTYVGTYSLICEQCYYFLKNVEKFKTKCIETQKKLYSMNIETIKDTHDAVLQFVANDVSSRGQQKIFPHFNLETTVHPVLKRSAKSSPIRPNKQLKGNLNFPVIPTVSAESEITLSSLLSTAAKPFTSVYKTPTTLLSSSTADDLLQLFDSDATDLQDFHKFAVRDANVHEKQRKTDNGATEDNTRLVINFEDDEEYMTRSDLISAGLLPDDSNECANLETQAVVTESGSEDDMEIIDLSENSESSSDSTKSEELKISEIRQCGNNNKKKRNSIAEKVITNNEVGFVPLPMTATVKKEILEDENPGFFNKKSTDGYYKCRICDKQYKRSKGLYEHTKKIHGAEVKIHHCDYCSFFTLWKSALVRHHSIFHTEIFEEISPPLTKCHHCSFIASSNKQLRQHMTDTHLYEKFIRCKMCRSRFADGVSFAKHVENDHPS